MKYSTFSLCCLIFVMGCSTNNDVAVTQTGNPTQVSLMIKADTSGATQGVSLPKRTVTGITIESAYIVVKKVEMEPVDGTEIVLFQGQNPYIVELLPDGGSGLVDTTHVNGVNTYESVEVEFGPFSVLDSTVQLPDTLLKTNSVLVRGYVNSNPLDSFVFASNIAGDFEFPLDSALMIADSTGANILVSLKVYEWFTDSVGNTLDPRDVANRSSIEENLLGSVSVSEHEGDFESDE
ncbi:MAG: hypothetical protein JXA96_17405 [Sedimentisphaerales bacterium]|nr:hypothetical protein [Sedimentisphaerales bacterium]